MNTKSSADLLSYAKSLLDISRAVIKNKLASGFSSQIKADSSIVTEVDIAIEEALRKDIEKHFPDHGIIGEEFGVSRPEADFQWILDPIDGTEEFANGMPFWGTIIGLHYKSSPVVGIIDHPALDVCLYAAKGWGAFKNEQRIKIADLDKLTGKERISITTPENFLRFNGCKDTFNKILESFPNIRVFRSCYGHTTAITGSTDAMVEYNVRIWDIAATQILVEEAGGSYVVVKKTEEEVGMVYGAVFGRQALAQEIVKKFSLSS